MWDLSLLKPTAPTHAESQRTTKETASKSSGRCVKAITRGGRISSHFHRRLCSPEEIHDTSLQVVHPAGDLDCLLRLKFREHGAVLSNVGDRDLHILARDGVDKGVIRCRSFTRVGCRVNRGFDLRQQACEI